MNVSLTFIFLGGAIIPPAALLDVPRRASQEALKDGFPDGSFFA